MIFSKSVNRLTIIFVIILINSILLSQSNHLQNNTIPITPKWVFEPWVWEDSINTQTSTWNLVTDYLDRDIPVGAVIIDSPWETGYNTFEFDSNRYPDAEKLITDLRNVGVHTILWITGVLTTDSPNYDYACSHGYFIKKIGDPDNCPTTYFWKGSKEASHIDFFNSDAIAWWESLMEPILNLGVDGWKVDMSDHYVRELGATILTAQGEKTKEEYSEAFYREMYNYIVVKREQDKAMITARPYCSQKGPNNIYAPIDANTAGWVGDQQHNWGARGLPMALNDMFISADLGYGTVGSDIGGYLKFIWVDGGNIPIVPDKNLLIRWGQLGAMMPIMENGGTSEYQHLPWNFDQQTVDIYRYFSKLHHQLVPFFYSYILDAHNTGTSIVRVIGEGSANDTSNWNKDWRYFLGDEIFCAAIYEDVTSRSITFPTGKWIDYWNDDTIYSGGETAELNFPIDKYPIFIKSGAIIPMNVEDSETGHGSDSSKNHLTLIIYPDGESALNFNRTPTELVLIENFENSESDSIHISSSTEKYIIRTKLSYQPNSILLNSNTYLTQVNSSVEFDNSFESWYYDSQKKYCWIKFSADDSETSLTIDKSQFISNIQPSSYELAILNVGNKYYVDRNYTIQLLPNEYKNLQMIKTANNDKSTVGLDFHFDLSRKSNVYVAYDSRLSTPSWISNEYTFTGKSIDVSDTGPDSMLVWEKISEPGTITFGDNNTSASESSMYFVFCKQLPNVKLSCKTLLQGPFENGTMLTTLNQNGNIPLHQPFNESPWFYEGNENVTSFQENVVDWILIELRNKTDHSIIEARRAGLILSDGTIVETDGSSPVQFFVQGNSYYIALKHRNHLSVLSSEPILFVE